MSRSLLCSHILQIKHSNFNNIVINVLREKHLFVKPWKNVTGKISYRHFAQKGITKKYVPFMDFINFRKEEAKRSIIVQVQSAHSYKELHAYCNQVGTVNRMFHYTSGVEPLHFILIEFATEDDVHNVLSSSCHVDDTQAVPVKSPFLWFRVSSNNKSNLKVSKNFKLEAENGTKLPAAEAISELIRSSENISDQMKILYELTKLNDLGFRLRFLTARQVELAVSGMFPDAVAYPFGSSINGYGKLGCDLDLILKLNGYNKESAESRLIYQCKAGLGNERSQSQRHMEAIGDLLHLFLPGCSQVRRILQARVPILKYNQQFTDIECDLSMTNMTALHMSELLYLLGSMDERVRPLVFTIRRWASEVGLTNSSPGRWITNFSLTLLVLAFLQRIPTSEPLLPSLNNLMKRGGKPENNLEDGASCSFIHDLRDFKNTKKNTETLETLLFQFFEYYSNFDFTTKAISLNEAAVITKPEHNALYIVNPLERGLNVSKNVSLEELERLKIELRNAAWILESQEKKTGKWGIMSIFTTNSKPHRNFFAPVRQNRMMEVKKLFEDEQNEETGDEKTMKFKNEIVKKQIENIKKETAERIEELKEKPKRQSANRRR